MHMMIWLLVSPPQGSAAAEQQYISSFLIDRGNHSLTRTEQKQYKDSAQDKSNLALLVAT